MNNIKSLSDGSPICITPDTVYEQALGHGLDNANGHSVPLPESKGVVDTVVWNKIISGEMTVDEATAPAPIPI